MPILLDSQEELSKRSSFSLLPSDTDYICYIGSIREEQQSDYNDKTKMVDVLTVRLLLVSEKSGGAIVDESDKEIQAESMVMTKFGVNPSSTGFCKTGEPSNFRALIAYATGQNVSGSLTLDSVNDLVGKYIAINVQQYKPTNGTGMKNKVASFKKLPRTFTEPDAQTQQRHKAAFDAVQSRIEASIAKKAGNSAPAKEATFVDPF